jgi:hypothetical protein
MDKIKDKVKKYQFFWYYPQSKTTIKLISKGTNKKDLQEKVLQKTKKLDDIPLVLLELNYQEKPTNLLPGKVIVKVKIYLKENNKLILHPKFKNIGLIHFDEDFLLNYNFKFTYLKNIIQKVFFNNIKLTGFGKYYEEL